MPAATTVLCPASPHPQSAAQFPDLSGPQSRLPRLCTLSVHHFLSVTIKCTSDLPRLIGDLIRPDTGHPPTYEPDTPRAAQTMTAVRGREAISMFIVQAEEAFAPRLVPGRDRGQQLGQRHQSLTQGTCLLQSYWLLTWNSNLPGCPVLFQVALLQSAVLSQPL